MGVPVPIFLERGSLLPGPSQTPAKRALPSHASTLRGRVTAQETEAPLASPNGLTRPLLPQLFTEMPPS